MSQRSPREARAAPFFHPLCASAQEPMDRITEWLDKQMKRVDEAEHRISAVEDNCNTVSQAQTQADRTVAALRAQYHGDRCPGIAQPSLITLGTWPGESRKVRGPRHATWTAEKETRLGGQERDVVHGSKKMPETVEEVDRDQNPKPNQPGNAIRIPESNSPGDA
ncbi:hypothetical protein NDU88_003460 [Pleurodeles waltl]|uniref:Uncharacterized protein n=1 Tax=Pleurodeles waltl TaxID=8319 RepID=A0AAV7NKQ5_PLEWA|nr:hypothetical protein NDU88_003460 [Pleurodeles waltl]